MPRALLRRVRRAWRRNGPVGFARLGARNIGLLLRGEGAGHRHVHDRAFDHEHGTDTSGVMALDEISAPEHAKHGAVPYEATPPGIFDHLLVQAGVTDSAGLTFIDLGSGKGRTLLLASLAGFPRAEGVELGEELHAIACRNIQTFKQRSGGGDIVAIRGDARDFRFPPVPTVCFLNNPFSADILAQVVARMEASLATDPRPFTVIYYHSNHADVFERRPGWEKLAEGFWADPSHHFAAFRWTGGEAVRA